ncbi:PREDICTED: breast cancer type 2 susceptibility protein homolog isoform X2 [Drosophila arizonae]|uniref:Breast cancer type 2 susceptibility protein homolog isoform X2 n=1 Tax=Drosophila arizonae TaxID=7263 RepID=A0ABM1PM56_DROAR|nr:PREDICTED: breast cancer type 2 susceptibility protein homolog isoform X2 [Drosophila arizonae]
MADDDDDDDYSITASPTELSDHCSLRQKRRNPYNVPPKLSTVTRGSCEKSKQELPCDDWEYEADRLDCLRAQQEPVRVHLIPASQNFTTLQSMLKQHDMKDIEDAEPDRDITETANIAQQILRDFCESPTYFEDDDQLLLEDYSPWFRFRSKRIKTYRKERLKTSSPVITDDDEDRLSCSSSELSVQEDYNTQVPTRTNCVFDPNSSQKICENLLNLSAFFSTQSNANKSINLPDMKMDLKNSTVLEANDFEDEDATGILEEMGYFIGGTEQCKYLEDNCDSKIIDNAEFSLFRDETTGRVEKLQDTNLCDDKNVHSKNTQLEAAKETSEIELLEEIALSEWQPMEIDNSSIKEQQEKDCKEQTEMEMIAFSEWQPVELIDNPIEIQEPPPKEKARYLHEIRKVVEAKCPVDNSNSIQFHTASNKAMKLTEEMKRKAAMLMADLETVGQEDQAENENMLKQNQAADSKRDEAAANCELLAGIPLSEWQPMAIPDSKEADGLDASNQLDMIPLSEWQPIDIPDGRANTTKDQQQKEATDWEVSPAQQKADCKQNGIPENIQFRTASNRALTLTKEMKQKAAMLMADLETVSTNPPTEQRKDKTTVKAGCSQSISEDDKNVQPNISECVQFHTASKKVLKLTEEMRQKAAMLMADLEPNQLEGTQKRFDDGCTVENKSLASQQTLKEGRVPKLIIETIDGIYPLDSEVKQPKSTVPREQNLNTQNRPDLIYETPKCTTELQSSLTQLSERSPLDRKTKSSIITRRNLLSLNKRRKQKRNSENCNADAGHTPIRRFASMAAATSTPMPSHRGIDVKENEDSPQPSVRERSCSQDSPRVERKRICKRKSEDALSPIYAPTHKTRRLGLSRIRNKSTHEI